MSDDELTERLKQAQLTPSRINPYTVPADQHGWRGLNNPAAPKRKIYTILHNEQVLVTLLLRFPGEAGPFGARHHHDSGELSIHFEGNMTPIVGWSPPGEPHVHAAPRNPAAELREALKDLTEGGGPNPEASQLAAGLSALLQIPSLNEWLESLFRPEPRLLVTVDVLFPPFTTYAAQPGGGYRKIIGQWYD